MIIKNNIGITNKKSGIALISLIIICTIIIILIFVSIFIISKIKNKGNNYSTSTVENINIDNENTNKNDKASLKYWLKSQNWANIAEKSSTKLFSTQLTLPIDILSIDSVCAPYTYRVDGKALDADSIKEILNYNKGNIAANGKWNIVTQSKYVNGEWENADIPQDYIDNIYLKNYSDTPISAKQSYDNGWWYIESSPAFDSLDNLLNNLGRPKYIELPQYCYDAFQDNDGLIGYKLIYEKADYVAVYFIKEYIYQSYNFQKDPELTQYYYTKESWEYEKSNEDIIKIINNNGIDIKIVKKFS